MSKVIEFKKPMCASCKTAESVADINDIMYCEPCIDKIMFALLSKALDAGIDPMEILDEADAVAEDNDKNVGNVHKL